jgi:hypothetical protein
MEQVFQNHWVEFAIGIIVFVISGGYYMFRKKVNMVVYNLGKAVGSLLRRRGLDDEAAELGQNFVDGLKSETTEKKE